MIQLFTLCTVYHLKSLKVFLDNQKLCLKNFKLTFFQLQLKPLLFDSSHPSTSQLIPQVNTTYIITIKTK